MAENDRTHNPDEADPPGTWSAGRRLARIALAPIERFLAVEASSGIVLLVAAAAALAWANSPRGDSYLALWHTPLGLRVGPWSFERDLHFLVNDGLMTLFFFVVGLEIRREIHHGELSEPKRAALPLAAALGGMLAPAGIFLALNGAATARGWGVPMATDIAFAVGVLALLGRRVPPALRVLLLALAVIDDVGSIVVIALFYSAGIAWTGLLVVALGMGAIIVLQRFGVRTSAAYVVPGLVVWAGAYAAGVHPTLAGVIVGLMTPVRAGLRPERFFQSADSSVAALRGRGFADEHAVLPHIDDLTQALKQAISPVERLQHLLHGWVAFGVMPLFAFANAGVQLDGLSLSGDGLAVFLGVSLGLVAGKPIGILAASWVCVRLGLAALPRGVTWRQAALVGLVGGIGFTMAIFIAQLAFAGDGVLDAAKAGILAASGSAALAALISGRFLLPAQVSGEAARSAEEAETSTAT